MNVQSTLYHIGNFEEIGEHTLTLPRSTVFMSPFSRMYLSHVGRVAQSV